jgi:hypothetical protein
MYRLKGTALLTMALLVLGAVVNVQATTYYWRGDNSTDYRQPSTWQDSLGNSPASTTDLDNLLNNASLGGVFIQQNAYNDMLINSGQWTVNAPFRMQSTDANDPSGGLYIYNPASASITYTFNDLEFQGTFNLRDPENPFYVAGAMKLTGPFTIMARGTSGSPYTAANVYLTALIDGSRIDTYRCQWRQGTSTKSPGNLSSVRLANANNAFFGEWILSTRLIADVDGALGDADVNVLGTTDMQINPPTDANIATYNSGKNQGILWLRSSGAISPTARLTLGAANSTTTPAGGKVVIDTGVTAQVRQLVVDNVSLAAGTYGAADLPGRIEGSGTITVAGVDATAVLTMACTKGDGGPTITGDTCLMPRVGTKAYKAGYAARIRAKSSLSISGVNYLFAHWSGTGIANVNSTDTTVTMDASKTVTAVYTQSPGASTPSPANAAGNVSVATSLSWTPDAAATSSSLQDVYFGSSSTVLTKIATLVGTSVNSVTNAQLGGALREQTNYYWRIVTDGAPGTLWVFTTGLTKATTPSPATGVMGQSTSPTLTWTSPDTGATSWDVYFGTNRADVENGLATKTTVTGTPQLAQSSLARGMWYYWRVDVKFATTPAKTTIGDVWRFRTTGYSVVINTDTGVITDETGTPPTFTASVDDADVRILNFTNFNYGQQFDITVTGSKRLAIWSNNDITLGAVLNASAANNSGKSSGTAVAGGYLGGDQIHIMNKSGSTDPNFVPNNYRWYPPDTRTTSQYWVYGDMSYWRNRNGADPNYKMPRPNDSIYGPGRPYAQGNYQTAASPKIRSDTLYGAGGTYGGFGGGSINMGGGSNPYLPNHAGAYASYPALNLPGTYGTQEVYELWGGSGGSGGGRGGLNSTQSLPSCRARGGAGGGGAVEFYSANGSITLTGDAQILANGGSTLCDNGKYADDQPATTIGTTGNPPTPGGAGSGGSIRLIAKNSITMAGTLSANGGHGADAPPIASTLAVIGAGGGGGRIALYKGTSVSIPGTITVAGGLGGRYTAQPTASYAQVDGRTGTVYGLSAGQGNVTALKVAHDPIPTDGTGLTDANFVTLKWRPALGTTTMNLYYGTANPPTTLATSYTPAGGASMLRKQQSFVTGSSSPIGTTYYWRVECDGVMGPTWSYKVLSYEPRTPVPTNGATEIDPNQPVLQWAAGDAPTATSWDVYLGTDKTVVTNANTSTTGIYQGAVTIRQKVAPQLRASTTYYWRVDEHNTKPAGVYKSLTWSFTTSTPTCTFMYSDMNGDCRTTFVDFAVMAANWKKCNMYAGCP